MSLKSSSLTALLLVAATATSAVASEKCAASRARICDGCSVTVHWQVPQSLTGPAAAHSFCRNRWANLGGHIQFTVVQPPRAGTVHVHDYVVAYRGDRPGHDRMTLHATWYSPSHQTFAGDITYDITVIPRS